MRLRLHFTRSAQATTLVAAVVLGALAPTVTAADTRYRAHPGYVDGAHFVDLADPHGRLIEVTLHGKLLNLLCTRALGRHDKQLADILDGLVSMQAVVAEVTTISDDDESASLGARRHAEVHIKDVARQLDRGGWERFVRVREGDGEEYNAFVRINDRDEVDGLVVMGFTGGSELIFVNLAGEIDMEAVALLGERFDVPGLDNLPNEREVRDRHAQSSERRSGQPNKSRDNTTLSP